MEYRIVTVRSADSGEPVGYFDRWHALVFLGDQRLGCGQGFTRRRAESRAKKAARLLHRASDVRTLRPVRETSYRPPASVETESPPPTTQATPAEQVIQPDHIKDIQTDLQPVRAIERTSREDAERLDTL